MPASSDYGYNEEEYQDDDIDEAFLEENATQYLWVDLVRLSTHSKLTCCIGPNTFQHGDEMRYVVRHWHDWVPVQFYVRQGVD